MMEIPEGKVSLLDAVPVRCGHITTEWEGECAVLAYPRFKYEWMRRFLLPKGMSPDIHVRLEEHGTAVWNLIDGHRTVREIISLLARHFGEEENYIPRVTAYVMQLIYPVDNPELEFLYSLSTFINPPVAVSNSTLMVEFLLNSTGARYSTVPNWVMGSWSSNNFLLLYTNVTCALPGRL